jgi:hypothetical protein
VPHTVALLNIELLGAIIRGEHTKIALQSLCTSPTKF